MTDQSAIDALRAKVIPAQNLLIDGQASPASDGGTLDVKKDSNAVSARQTIITGMLLNVLNPKLSLFFMAFLPQFVPASSGASTSTLVLLAAVFMVLTFIIFVAYGAFASLARDYVISRPEVMKWCKRAFAGSFGLLGLAYQSVTITPPALSA